MFAIEVHTVFCAAHALRIAGTPGETEALHGHNFHVTVRLTCQKLDEAQTVADFHAIETLLGRILGPWNNQNLNLLEEFRGRVNPSAERIAEHIGLRLQAALGAAGEAGEAGLDDAVAARGLRVAEVRLTEAPGCLAVWQA